MEFEIILREIEKERQVLYFNQEQSFDMNIIEPSHYSLMLGCAYLGLDFSLNSLEIVNISGFCPNNLWINKSLVPPNILEYGIIKIIKTDDLVEGAGEYLFDKSVIYYDTTNNYCYIDAKTGMYPDRYIQVFKNVIISLCNQKLVGLWIKVIEGNR